MNYDFDELMKESLAMKETPSKELNQLVLDQCKGGSSMKHKSTTIAAAVAIICIVLAGGTTIANAATGGKIFNSLLHLFDSTKVYENGSKTNVEICDNNGIFQVKNFDEDGVGWSCTFDDYSSEDSYYILRFKLFGNNDKAQHGALNQITIKDWYDEEDIIWLLRMNLVDNFRSIKDNDNNCEEFREELIAQYKTMLDKTDDANMKKAITLALDDIKDISLGKDILITYWSNSWISDVDEKDIAWFRLDLTNAFQDRNEVVISRDCDYGYEGTYEFHCVKFTSDTRIKQLSRISE